MDAYGSNNERWRLLAFAGFIICSILIIFFNNSLNSSNLSLLQITPVSIAAEGEDKCKAFDSELISGSNVQSSTPSNATVKEKLKRTEKGEECEMFEGKWVYDPNSSPLYDGQNCPFISDSMGCQRNGRPDNEYEKWIWEAKGCQIPKFNATDMLVKLRGKRMIIVGDSLSRNQWESLVCLLYSDNPRARIVKGYVFMAKDYNFSVEFYWSPFLVELDNNGSRILRLDRISTTSGKWKYADIMLFNSGHWWMQNGKFKAWDLFEYKGKVVNLGIESAYKRGLRTWAKWVDKNVEKNSTIVFFRSVSPEHLGKSWCYGKTKPMTGDEFYQVRFPKAMVEIIEKTIGGMRTKVKYLNITKLSQYRIDAHPTIYAYKQEKVLKRKKLNQVKFKADCSHWCLPGLPDTWNRLLYASILSALSS